MLHLRKVLLPLCEAHRSGSSKHQRGGFKPAQSDQHLQMILGIVSGNSTSLLPRSTSGAHLKNALQFTANGGLDLPKWSNLMSISEDDHRSSQLKERFAFQKKWREPRFPDIFVTRLPQVCAQPSQCQIPTCVLLFKLRLLGSSNGKLKLLRKALLLRRSREWSSHVICDLWPMSLHTWSRFL